MSNIVKLETLNFPRLNNAEFTYFAGPWRRFTWTLPLLRASRATTGSWWTS